jgi:transcriptional regulator with XRE-family HTH domain
MTSLARIRKERHLTLRQLSALIEFSTGMKISSSELSRVERGVVSPKPWTREMIARTLKVDPSELFEVAA